MKIKYAVLALTVLIQTALFSSCVAPSPQMALQDAVSGQEQADPEAEGRDNDAGNNDIIGSSDTDDAGEYAALSEKVYIHICGAVRSPGVYALPAGSRLGEAVEAAGGLLPEACQDYCNLAQVVSDGMQYRIPAEDEALEGGISWGGLTETAQGDQSAYDSQGLLDINLATAAELMELPGIGQTRADAIIAYREDHGAFACKEDIMQVTGIKGATYEKIEDYITTR